MPCNQADAPSAPSPSPTKPIGEGGEAKPHLPLFSIYWLGEARLPYAARTSDMALKHPWFGLDGQNIQTVKGGTETQVFFALETQQTLTVAGVVE